MTMHPCSGLGRMLMAGQLVWQQGMPLQTAAWQGL